MVGESLAIIAVILVMAAMMARSGRQVFSAFTLPLISIPVFHVAGALLRLQRGLIVADSVGLLVGLLLCVLFSHAFRSKRGRRGYLVFCCLFMVALFGAYLLQQI